ncbi:MAG: CHAT domain-containing protein, partial [Planctomycetota bacterium]
IRRPLAQEQPKVYRPDVAITLNNLGAVLCNLSELDAARAAYQEALEIRRPLAQEQPKVYARNLSGLCDNSARMLSSTGEFDQADELLTEGERALQALTGAGAHRLTLANFYDSAGSFRHRWQVAGHGEPEYGRALEFGERGVAALGAQSDSESRLDLQKAKFDNALRYGVYSQAREHKADLPSGRLPDHLLIERLESLRNAQRRVEEWAIDAKPIGQDQTTSPAEPELDDQEVIQVQAEQRRRGAETQRQLIDQLSSRQASLMYIQPTPHALVFHLLGADGRCESVVAPNEVHRMFDSLYLNIGRMPRFAQRHTGTEGRAGGIQICRKFDRDRAAKVRERMMELGGQGYRLLHQHCRPVTRWIDEYGDRLWISPHAEASRWSLAYLVGDSGQPLGLRYTFPRTTGLESLVQSLDRHIQPGKGLVIGNPTLSHTLPYAEESAREIEAELVKRSVSTRLLLGNECSHENVLTALKQPDLSFFLFTGHGGQTSRGSVALLADSIDDQGKINPEVLWSTDLLGESRLGLEWRNHPWVHLDCCHGAAEVYGGGGRSDGLIYATLRSGASAVLASTHTVGDEDSKTFASEFYQRWLGGASAGDSLLNARQRLYEEAKHDTLLWGMPTLHGNADVTAPLTSI